MVTVRLAGAFLLATVTLVLLSNSLPGSADAAPASATMPTKVVAHSLHPSVSKHPHHVAAPRTLPVRWGGPAPPPKHPSAAPRFLRPFVVNPQSYYSAEPAPMGLADFGVDTNYNAYSYNTTQFYGDIKLGQLSTSATGVGTQMGYQLNVVLWFDSHGTSYYYWIQDVAFLDTSTYTIYYLNNIWNFSASGAKMATSDVNGNGSVQSGYGFYYCGASSILPGNYVTLTTPADIGLKAVSVTKNGQAVVKFEYQDGAGWVDFDDVTFAATSVTDHGFYVDGSNYNPTGYLFNDAELIMGGPGGGSDTNVTASAQRMTLSYWNGHNFQEVTDAWNHGSDTAEGVANSTIGLGHFTRNGTLYANATAGAGSLGSLYDRSYSAALNITTSYRVGSIEINGTSEGNFSAGEMNLTLAPGKYSVGVVENSTIRESVNLTIKPGSYQAVFFAGGPKYNVTFTESGLPAGTNWSVTLGGFNRSSTTSSIRIPIWNGTWGFALGYVPNWSTPVESGQVSVAGKPLVLASPFSRVTYRVVFSSSGLPAGTNWSVTFGNSSSFGINPLLTFLEPNGTFLYRIGPLAGYVASPVAGSVDVAPPGKTVRISWSLYSYPVFFNSTGLPAGTLWGIVTGKVVANTTGTSLRFLLPNGTHAWSTLLVPGYRPSQGSSGQLSVLGRPAAVLLAWTPVTYTVSVEETGLPAGTPWQATLGAVTVSGAGSTLVITEANGSYPLSLGRVAGFYPAYYPNGVQVRGADTTVPVSFAPTVFPIQFTIAGLPVGAVWAVQARSASTWVNGTASIPTLNLSLSNGTWTYLVTVPYGWVSTPGTGSLTIDGSSQSVSLVAGRANGYLTGPVSPSGATVFIDGKPATVSNGILNATLSAGRHSIEVTAPGFAPYFDNVTIYPGKATDVPLTLSRLTATGTPGVVFGLSYFELGLIGLAIIVIAVVAAVARRGREPPSPEDPYAPPATDEAGPEAYDTSNDGPDGTG